VKRTLLLARHGETDWNLQQRWQGHTDVPLNAAGRAQARELAERLRELRVARVHASDLARARETAEIVARTLGVAAVQIDPGLRERGFGVFEGLTGAECEQRYPEEWERYRSNLKVMPPGSEPHDDVTTRMQEAVRRVLALTDAEAPALVVSHGGALRLLIGAITGTVPPPIGNVGVFRAHVAGDVWEIIEPLP
jgi:broad specificity phosphatase PhoE